MSLWQNRKMEMAGLYFMFRADPQIGTGHLFRCCKIADFIRRKYGIRFAFNLTGGVRPETRRLLEGRRVFSMGTHVEKLPCFSDRPALIVLDDYSIGFEEELKIRESSYRLIVIDDLMRKHSCDVLIDGNILRTPEDYAASAGRSGKCAAARSTRSLRGSSSGRGVRGLPRSGGASCRSAGAIRSTASGHS